MRRETLRSGCPAGSEPTPEGWGHPRRTKSASRSRAPPDGRSRPLGLRDTPVRRGSLTPPILGPKVSELAVDAPGDLAVGLSGGVGAHTRRVGTPAPNEVCESV